MEELYRRVSDRQTMGSVVQELRASLSEAEKLIDQFFRKPAERQVLIPVPNQLSAMRGVLSVLGMDQATAALLRMRDEVEGLVQTEIDLQRVAQTGVFDRLAGNLGALGFLIDMLSVQPQMAKSLFVFDPRTGTLDPVMGRGSRSPPASARHATELPWSHGSSSRRSMLAFNAARHDVPVAEVARDLERLSHEAQRGRPERPWSSRWSRARRWPRPTQADDREGVASVRGELTDVLGRLRLSTSEPMGLASSLAPVARRHGVCARAAVGHRRARRRRRDARDLPRGSARGAARRRRGHGRPGTRAADLALLTTVRRAFHTLKGSSRMVGLQGVRRSRLGLRAALQHPARRPPRGADPS